MMDRDETMAEFISQGVDRAKTGNAKEVYSEVVATGKPVPERSHYAYGWILYYALHQAAEGDVAWRKRLLAEYLKLRTPRPHKLHSMVLTEAISLRGEAAKAAGYPRRKELKASDSFSLVRFLPLWDCANLRPGDWNRHNFEDKQLSSTVEKLITAYVAEIEETKAQPSAEFIAIIDRAINEYPDNFNLLCQRASLFAIAGETEPAKDMLKKALVMAPGKFHIWNRLAMLINPVAEPRLKMALLARSLTAPGPSDFKGRIRLDLASIWLEQGFQGQAVHELAEVKRLYDSKQWHLPRLYTALAEKIQPGTAPISPSSTYAKLLPMADEYIYSAIPSIAAKKTYHKNPEPTAGKWKSASQHSWRVTTEDDTNYWFQPIRFGIDPRLPMGTPVSIRVASGRLVHASLS